MNTTLPTTDLIKCADKIVVDNTGTMKVRIPSMGWKIIGDSPQCYWTPKNTNFEYPVEFMDHPCDDNPYDECIIKFRGARLQVPYSQIKFK